jgi:hypothetical protein
MSVKRGRCLGAGLVVSWLFGASTASAAPPCAGGEGPATELRVVAAALAPETDRSLVVSVFDDGCVQVHRPAYRRDAGDFRVDLDAAALDALRSRVDQSALRAFDAKRVQADIAAAQRKPHPHPILPLKERASLATDDSREQRYSELDADRYEIIWRSGSKRGAAAWPGLPAYAARYTDNASLQAFSSAASALLALAERSDARRIDGGRP